MNADVLVVGAGPAGLAAAVELRKLGAGRVLVVDRDEAAGGSGPASASLISPRVTRSQWQTIRPYSGSAAIRAASWYGRGPAWPM